MSRLLLSSRRSKLQPSVLLVCQTTSSPASTSSMRPSRRRESLDSRSLTGRSRLADQTSFLVGSAVNQMARMKALVPTVRNPQVKVFAGEIRKSESRSTDRDDPRGIELLPSAAAMITRTQARETTNKHLRFLIPYCRTRISH